MARKKKATVPATPAVPVLSELERQMQKMSMENEQMKLVLDEQEAQLSNLNKVNAMKRMALGQPPEPTPETVVEDESEETFGPAGSTLPLPDPAAGNYDSNSEFERELSKFVRSNEGTIEILRVKENGTEAKLGVFSIKDWGSSLEKCAKSYGGGEFKAIIRDSHGYYRGNTRVIYDEDAYPRPAAKNAPAPLATGSPDLAELFRTIQAQQDKQQDKMFTMITAMVQTMNSKPSGVSSLEDMIRIKKLLEPSAVEAPNPLKDVSTLLGLFQKGVEAGERLSPAADAKSEGGFMDIISALAPAMAPMLAKVMSAPTKPSALAGAVADIRTAATPRPLITNPPATPVSVAPPPAAPLSAADSPAPAPAEAEVVPQQSTEEKDMGFAANMMIAMYKGPVLEMAKSGHDPDKTAEMIILRIPETYYPIALDFTVKPDRLDLTFAFIPELKEHREWTDKVLESGKEILTQYFRDLDEDAKIEAGQAAAEAAVAQKEAEIAEATPPELTEPVGEPINGNK